MANCRKDELTGAGDLGKSTIAAAPRFFAFRRHRSFKDGIPHPVEHVKFFRQRRNTLMNFFRAESDFCGQSRQSRDCVIEQKHLLGIIQSIERLDKSLDSWRISLPPNFRDGFWRGQARVGYPQCGQNQRSRRRHLDKLHDVVGQPLLLFLNVGF